MKLLMHLWPKNAKNARSIRHWLLNFKLIFVFACISFISARAGFFEGVKAHFNARNNVLGDLPAQSCFVLHLNNYQYLTHDLHRYSLATNKNCQGFSVSAIKDYVANIRRKFPDLKHAVYAVNTEGFTKARYLLALKRAFASQGLNMADRHVLQMIIDYVWAPEMHVKVSIKDMLYLINGMDSELLIGNSPRKLELSQQLMCSTYTDILPSAILVDLFLRNKLIIIDSNTGTYTFNKKEVAKIPLPSYVPVIITLYAAAMVTDADLDFTHLLLRCDPEQFKQMARKHTEFLGIKERAVSNDCAVS